MYMFIMNKYKPIFYILLNINILGVGSRVSALTWVPVTPISDTFLMWFLGTDIEEYNNYTI